MAHVPPLEAILDCLAVELEPFAICKVARGWRLRMGAAPSATFHFVLADQGRLRVGSDFSGSIGSRCLCIVPPGVGHALESGEHIVREATAETVLDRAGDLLRFVARGDDGLTVACGRAEARYSGGLRLFDMLRAPVLIDFSDSPQMQALFEQILEEERGQGVGSKAIAAALMNACLVLLLRRLQADPECPLPWLASLRDPRMALLLEAVAEEPAAPYSVASLAEKAFMSRSAFSQRFKALFGIGPLAFVNEVRLRKGSELLLTTELTVDAVARSVGYSSRSHFSRAFSARFGAPPASFRASSNGSTHAGGQAAFARSDGASGAAVTVNHRTAPRSIA
jgi:AraC family transcriptional regulator, activator of mtrCDE